MKHHKKLEKAQRAKEWMIIEISQASSRWFEQQQMCFQQNQLNGCSIALHLHVFNGHFLQTGVRGHSFKAGKADINS